MSGQTMFYGAVPKCVWARGRDSKFVGLVGVMVLAAGGCAQPVWVVSQLAGDGTLTRQVDQPVVVTNREGQTQVPSPDQTVWQTASVGWGRCRLTGRFGSDQPVPDHWRAQPLGSPLVSVNRAQRQLVDLGVMRIHRFEETITNSVTPEDFRAARRELIALVWPVVEVWLNDLYGGGYLIDEFKTWLRGQLIPVVEKMTDRAYQAAVEQPPDRPNIRELFRRTAEPTRELGLKIDPDQPTSQTNRALARLWAAVKVRELVKKAPGGQTLTAPEAFALIDQWQDPTWVEKAKRVGEQAVVTVYGSKTALDLRVWHLINRLLGVYGGPVVIFPKFAFDYQLTMPGEIIATSGRQTGRDRVVWRFSEQALYPTGLRMWVDAVELVPPPADDGGPRRLTTAGGLDLANITHVRAIWQPLGDASPATVTAVVAALRADLAAVPDNGTPALAELRHLARPGQIHAATARAILDGLEKVGGLPPQTHWPSASGSSGAVN